MLKEILNNTRFTPKTRHLFNHTLHVFNMIYNIIWNTILQNIIYINGFSYSDSFYNTVRKYFDINILVTIAFFNSFIIRLFSRHCGLLSRYRFIFWVLVYYYRRLFFAIALKKKLFSNFCSFGVALSSYNDNILIILLSEIITNFIII